MKNTTRFARVRIPKGFVLPRQVASQESDPAKVLRRRNLLDKARKLGLTEAVKNGATWSLERLDGAVFDRYCLWADAKRAGVRPNRRWSDRAIYDAMLRLKLQNR